MKENNFILPEEMTSVSLHAIGELVNEKRPLPEIGEDEVLVKAQNCGICGSDIGRDADGF